MSGVVVLFSGGQDSTTCLYLAIRDVGAENVLALTVDYGQRHAVELQSAKAIARLAKVKHIVTSQIDLSGVNDRNALTAKGVIKPSGGLADNEAPGGLPTTFVPLRNPLLLTIAAMAAANVGAEFVYTGVCQQDYSGYPDCRDSFVDAFNAMLAAALPSSVKTYVVAPLMFTTKADTVKLARSLPGCWDALALSHTCYRGLRPACMQCPACELRQKGFEEAGEVDPANQVVLPRVADYD